MRKNMRPGMKNHGAHALLNCIQWRVILTHPAHQRNNRLVAAGAMQAEEGRFAVKVPGVIESPEDVLSLPMKVEGERVVHFRDIATVRRMFAMDWSNEDAAQESAQRITKFLATNGRLLHFRQPKMMVEKRNLRQVLRQKRLVLSAG